jgi:hypothetical protein
MATLNVENKVVSFGDVAITNNPRQKYADWSRSIQGVEISEPITRSKKTISSGDALDIAGTDTQAGTISGIDYGITVTGVESSFTRTKLLGDFGRIVATITNIDSIVALNGGIVQFKVHTPSEMLYVSKGDIFYVKGAGTDDEDIAGPILPLNVGQWRVVKTDSDSMYCQKVEGCAGSINQYSTGTGGIPLITSTNPPTDQSLVVCNQLTAKVGDYVALSPSDFSPARPHLCEILYADAERIDIASVPFSIASTPFDATVCADRFIFAYIETDGEALVTVQVGGTNPDYQIPVIPIEQPSGELIGIFQLTSEFNFISVQNIDSKDIKVSAIVGG